MEREVQKKPHTQATIQNSIIQVVLMPSNAAHSLVLLTQIKDKTLKRVPDREFCLSRGMNTLLSKCRLQVCQFCPTLFE